MKIEIWSDFACPFCYLGKRRLEAALSAFSHKDDIEIDFRSFQLDVHAVRHENEDIHQLISKKYGIPYEQAKASNDQIIQAALEIGLHYDFDHLKPNHTGMAHQASKFAYQHNLGDVLVERFFKAYFEEGADLGDLSTLLTLAEEVGLNPLSLSEVLHSGQFKSSVLADQEEASKLGIRGVPYFIINGQYTVSGAQSPEHFLKVLQAAYTK